MNLTWEGQIAPLHLELVLGKITNRYLKWNTQFWQSQYVANEKSYYGRRTQVSPMRNRMGWDNNPPVWQCRSPIRDCNWQCRLLDLLQSEEQGGGDVVIRRVLGVFVKKGKRPSENEDLIGRLHQRPTNVEKYSCWSITTREYMFAIAWFKDLSNQHFTSIKTAKRTLK